MYELRSKSFHLSVLLAVVYVCSERMYWVIVGMSFVHAVIWGICLQLCFVRSKFYIVCGLHLSSVSACLFVFLGCFWVGFFFGNQVCMTLAQRLWRKRFLKTPNANFHSFLTNSPMKWTCPFIWKNWKSFSKGWLYHVCLTLTQRIWRRFLKHSTISVFSIFPN